jgi:two-component system, NarL family, response regulator DevR
LSEQRKPLRIYILDDHEVVRRGLAEILQGEEDFEVVGQAGTTKEALAHVVEAAPDVAVLDVRLPDGDGVEVCREIRAELPETRCLILTAFADDEALFAAIMAGAAGFLLKTAPADEMLEAIRTVGRGGSLLDPSVVERVFERVRERSEKKDDPLAGLTPQERRIFDLIAGGLTNREIAEQMFLAEKTVKNYVSNLLAKLGMSRRVQAALLAHDLKDKRERSD